MPEEFVDLGDVRLCVETFGEPDDPTLLMISGAAESMDGWEPAWCEAAGRRGSPGRALRPPRHRSVHVEPGRPPVVPGQRAEP